MWKFEASVKSENALDSQDWEPQALSERKWRFQFIFENVIVLQKPIVGTQHSKWFVFETGLLLMLCYGHNKK